MRTPLICIALVSVVLLSVTAQRTPAGGGAGDFFSGKNLDGWEGLMKFWSVKDGAIVGATTENPKHNTFLFTKKRYKDFEMKVKVRLKGGIGNTGIQIRSEILDTAKFTAKGPQVDMGAQYWGGLYGENFGGFMKQAPAAIVKKALKKEDFNDFFIKCVGKRVTIRMNGETTVDEDFPKLPDDGIIGFQLHQGPPMEVTFKDIEFTDLSQKKDHSSFPGSAWERTARQALPGARQSLEDSAFPGRAWEREQEKQQGPTPSATPAEAIRVPKDFKVELLYNVPRDTQGSWVNMCVDPNGKLIVSDQGGAGLFRVTPPPIGGKASDTKVEKIPADISGAQGLLCAFDSLYVMVNGGGGGKGKGGKARPNGLYRIKASKPGGDFDDVQLLRQLQGSGEHGPHAIVLSPDGKSLFTCAGNDTKVVNPLEGSLVPKLWGEDRLFPIVATFSGVVPPAGCIYRVDPDGKNWELWSCGYRNHYDIAFNDHGDLFTYDSDMEWDVNTPWYRPTRVYMASSGSDFGFRNGSNVFPSRYPDTLPAICDIGPGSPCGVCFGYDAKFPVKYQDAFYICDWSYGRLFAVHLTPQGSAYSATFEEFAVASPLALTDVVVNPKDGAMYFIVGGRNTQSGLYRITYTGKESTVRPPILPGSPSSIDGTRVTRGFMQALHGKADPKAIERAWPFLSHDDRFVRFAARVAIEHQDVKEWQDRALKETNPTAAVHALLALARSAGKSTPKSAETKEAILQSLEKFDWAKLNDSQRSDLLRVYSVLFARMGKPDDAQRERFIKRFDPLFPTKSYEVNADLLQLLVYLETPGIAAKGLKLIATGRTQEEQMEYVKSLRNLKTGWTLDDRKEYFSWFPKAANYKGGQRFQQYVSEIKQNATATLTAEDKEALKTVLAAKMTPPEVAFKPRPFVKKWSLDEISGAAEKGLTGRDFERGRLLFAETKCYSCHRFENEGGAQAPDLTQAAGRFSVRDFLESIIDPDKAVSDQYATSVFTLKDGKVVVGRVVNLQANNMSVMTDMLAPAKLTSVGVKNVESIAPSSVSPMPAGLLDTLTLDEILDLTAFSLSRGDRGHAMFRK